MLKTLQNHIELEQTVSRGRARPALAGKREGLSYVETEVGFNPDSKLSHSIELVT
jgi:hypothetical protein